jgi:FtsP/CotA-like multicopper oxidase with cupredoxin domain
MAAAAIAFAVLKPGDDSKTASTTTATAPATTPATTSTTPVATAPSGRVIRVKGGQPVGGVKDITVKQGDVIRLTVTSDAPEEVHLHGYDIAKDVGPGQPAVFVVPAKINGVFEVELEKSAVQIAKLTVEP